MKIPFYGREQELASLREENWRKKSMLAAVYGRRRVGKTALVEFAYKDDLLWKFEGIENGNTRTQIRYFLKQLSYCVNPNDEKDAADWDEAFTYLNQQIINTKKSILGKLVIFFDEFQWLCEMKGKLVSIFKYHWDNFLSKHPECIFVLCGSVSSFIVKKVIQSKALYGRVDLEINLLPLGVPESASFFKESICDNQVLDVHMVFGGIPQYLLELNPKMSLIQNINEYAFKPTGYFFQEFNRLFISHFSNHTIYEKVLRILAKGKFTLSELSKKCDISSGGNFSEKLRDMELAGFIKRQVSIEKRRNSRIAKYAIDDEFLHFYFKFIAPITHKIISGKFSFQSLFKTRDYQQWQGFAFERLCQKHVANIADYQRFSAIDYIAGPWFKRPLNKPGAQVDLVFLRSDKVLTACEIKYVDNIKASMVIDAFEKKLSALQNTFPFYSIEKILILGKGGSSNSRLKSYFDHILTADELFTNTGLNKS